jgi:predicted dehydrogenase
VTRIGLIGTGHFGAVHARAIHTQPDATLAAVCATDAATAKAFADIHSGEPYSDWRRMLERADIDAVVIATPHHLHEEMAIAAAQAGKHIFLEKPMAPTVAACRRISEAADAADIVLMVGHVAHFFRPIMAARAIIDGGTLGRPITGFSTYVKLWMEANRRDWHLKPETGGGMLMTAGIHSLDQFVWLMGGTVAGVSALAGTYFHDQEADDTAFIGLRFADGRVGQVGSVGYRDGAVSSFAQIVCEHGVIDIDLDRGVRIGRGGAWQDVPDSYQADAMQNAVAREWSAFLASIHDGSPSPVDGRYGRHTVAIIDAALRSSKEGREITISP